MKVVFIDRDGVINEFPGAHKYVTSWREFRILPGAVEAIRKLNSFGFEVFIVSNQAGAAKGLYSEKDLKDIDKRLLKALKKHQAKVRGIYYCMHRNEDGCDCRKPKIGLLTKALTDFKIKPQLSFFIGDSFIDMETAKSFGAKSILVLSGREKLSNRSNWKFEPDYVFDNLLVAADYICSNYG